MDAGTILLHVLSPRGMMGMGEHGGSMMHMEGQPPH